MTAENTIAAIKYKLATAIAGRRAELKQDQTQFAAACGTTQSMISLIENGRLDNLSIDKLIRINCNANTGFKLFEALK